ncbi:hypothetical protein DFH09DRAFT_390453 [Mycena vulgaris]|nr:hypothetical protein DFH09DRAFT_390453 [Mycena vulgaris]
MSEDALRARLDELSATINRQSEFPTLEQIRGHVQSELNAMRDPMSPWQMPLEIASDVFVRCLPTGAIIPDPNKAPLLLMNVSRAWRNIALATSAMWTNIEVEFPRAHGFEHLFDAWLKRAGTRATSISLRGPIPPAVALVVKQRAARVQKLELYPSNGKQIPAMTGVFSSLKTLTIEQNDRDLYRPEFFARSASGCVEIMRAAPNLVECNFHGVYFKGVGGDIPPLTHTSLRHLRLGREGPDGNTASILSYLTLPALQTLYMSAFDIEHNVAISFLTRSSPPLSSLSMEPPNNEWPAYSIANFFQLVPGLTDLEVRCAQEYEDHPPLLNALATFPAILPNLHNLTIRRFLPDRAGYENLVTMLSARRSGDSQIQSFRLLWLDHDFEDENRLEPDADIVVSLRQLVADGMHIHIGTQSTNLV